MFTPSVFYIYRYNDSNIVEGHVSGTLVEKNDKINILQVEITLQFNG